MKCFLLLLASGLVTSDKLDRTYLPPPGAKYSGGTLDDLYLPLEFPKDTYKGTIQNGPLTGFNSDNIFPGMFSNENFGKGMSIVPTEYLTSTLPNDLSSTTSFPINRYQSPVPTNKPGLYGSFPPTSPSLAYLPSKQTNFGTQSYIGSNSKPTFHSESNTNNLEPKVHQKDKKYYYYVPTIQNYKNAISNTNNGSPNAGLVQIPNQINNDYLLNQGQYYVPKAGPTGGIVQNYQPGAFGYYGGNPMIMTSQNSLPQKLGDMKLTSMFGTSESNASPINQERLKTINNASIRPFQTPLVRPNTKNSPKPSYSKIPTTPNTFRSEFPTSTTRSYLDKNVPKPFNQRSGIPLRPKFSQERPQTESERNAFIINYENNIYPEGYSYSYDTSNGIHADESGTATNGVRSKGSYSYTGDDGKIYTVTYTADENGFQPSGDHLPTAPPVPEAIKKIIAQAARDQAAGIIDDGSYDEKKYGHMNYLGAMDRYNLFKKNDNNVLNINNDKRKPNAYFQKANKKESANKPMQGKNLPITNGEVVVSFSPLDNLRSSEVVSSRNETYLPEIESNGKNTFNTGVTSEIEENNEKKEQSYNKIRRPITSVIDNSITNQEKEKIKPQNPNASNNPTNANVGTFNDGIIQNKTSGPNSGATFTDDGYYYVPPITKFNSITERIGNKQIQYLPTNKPFPTNIDTEANKRTGFNEYQRLENNDVRGESTPSPLNLNTPATEPTRQPYISGPSYQDKAVYYNTQESEKTQPATYPDKLDLSLYGPNTTPMTTETNLGSQPPVYSEYYQSAANPTTLDQTLPSVVEKRVNIPPGNPGITVSQDFVTTTYRPSVSGDGVLEVNQNVKIYGLGRPGTTTINNGNLDKVPDYNNNFYSAVASNGGSAFPEVYPDAPYIYTEPQDTAVFKKRPIDNIPYGNEYTTLIPGTNSNIIASPTPNFGYSEQPEGPAKFPDFSSNAFGVSELIPEQKLPISAIVTQNQVPDGRIIGEDFSGPKQPQQYDPETGYYYK